MSFNYDKISAKEGEHGSWWTSYADLFMMLSIVFLLMYVASSLRNGSAGVQQQAEYRQMAKRAEDLEQQIKVYNTLKDKQLQVAGDEEKKVYEKLMSKLTLLRDEAKDEKESLIRKAKENEEKEFALNQYQQLVQSIINTNLLAKTQIAHRDQTIDQQKDSIVALEAQKAALSQQKTRFEASLKHQKLTAAARAKKIAQFTAETEKKRHALELEISNLKTGKAQAEAGKARAEAEKSRALASVQQMQGELDRAQAIANAKKLLAKSIADNFSKAGVKGAVNAKSGEVTLDFGEEYFDTGRTDLKPKMKATLDRFMPVYSKSLFNDPNVAEKIASVEIVGFASSTYKGRYVNPKSLRPADKEAIDYNLKLSFGRANSIFKYLLNKNTLSKADQEKLFPLVKVVGRGYLPEGKDADKAKTGMTEKEFCQRFNCLKAQRVVVKFNMKD